MKRIFLLLMAIVVVGGGWWLVANSGGWRAVSNQQSSAIRHPPSATSYPLVTLQLLGHESRTLPFTVEVVSTPAAMERGLMFREGLPAGHGMLFVFSAEEPRSFWMKNTLIPLDIAFFAADGTLVSTATMTPCTARPCPLYTSAKPAQYALEVNAGALRGIEEDVKGWRLRLP